MAEEQMKELMKRLERIEIYTALQAKEVLTIEEAAAFTGYARNTLYQMTSKAKIPHYKRENKIYFLKKELETWMTAMQIPTEDFYKVLAENYCATHPLQPRR